MTIGWKKIIWGTAGISVALFPAFLLAHYDGPDSGHAGAPVTDDPLSCATSGCHTSVLKGGPVPNPAAGSVTATFSPGTYTPGGPPITVTVTATDPVNTHFGFQMTARIASTASSKTPQQAGSFNPGSNPNLIVLCSDNNLRPAKGCASANPYEYIEHYFSTYTAVYKTSQSYTFTWTPPAASVGNVNFYVAGNVVNFNNTDDGGDHVYTASYTLSPAFACTNTVAPAITFIDSASGYGGYSYFASGTWLEIKGTNLADPADPRLANATNPGQWTAGDFNGVIAPTSLDGISVSVNGKPAAVWYLSPTQLNVQAPEDTAIGNVQITVTNCKVTSPPFTFTKQALAPGMLAPSTYSANGTPYMIATFLDGAYVLNTSTGAAFGLNSRPAKPGDLIVAYGIGFGDVTPSILPGIVVEQANALVNPVTISFGSTQAMLGYAGLAGSYVGLYEFYIYVPTGLANGDYLITVAQNKVALPQTMYLTVHN
jgi:uncharacterized protein (TIGR03437 family)